MLDFVFQDGFGFETYARYALDVPMYFVKRDGRYIDASGQSFRAFMDGELPALPGERPTLKDWDDHLTTLFPEVRLKTYLEMRGADAGPPEPALRAGRRCGSGCSTTTPRWPPPGTCASTGASRTASACAPTPPRLGLKADGRRPHRSSDVAARRAGHRPRGPEAPRARCLRRMTDETGYLAELEEIAETGDHPRRAPARTLPRPLARRRDAGLRGGGVLSYSAGGVGDVRRPVARPGCGRRRRRCAPPPRARRDRRLVQLVDLDLVRIEGQVVLDLRPSPDRASRRSRPRSRRTAPSIRIV